MKYHCNYCQKEVIYVEYPDGNKVSSCHNPECPTFALVQVPLELMEKKEPAEWPQEEDVYWYLCLYEGVNVDVDTWDGGSVDLERKKYGMIFRTKKQAIKARNKIRRILNDKH